MKKSNRIIKSLTIISSVFLCMLLMATNSMAAEKKEEPPKIEDEKKYKNSFKELQRQRQIYEERVAKLKQQSAVKEGLKTTRKGGSRLEDSVKKKIAQINSKIRSKYERYIKPYHSCITRFSKELGALKVRLKMTDSSENTMERIAKLESEIADEKQEFYDKYVAFEPLTKDMLNKYKWAKYE